jgi:tRNA threonylcarbamoyladenosine modification (KEOPS) complex Cgi121 subunit
LYASGERQIQKAIEKIGIKKRNQKIAFIFIKENNRKISDDEVEHVLSSLNLKRDDKVLEGDVDTLKRFGITEDELSTIPESKYGDLLLEKVALVDIIK